MARKYVSVDASFSQSDDERRLALGGLAGVAGILRDREARVLFLDVVECHGAAQAEALALLRAMQIAQSARWESVEFRTDVDHLPDLVKGTAPLSDPVVEEARRLWRTRRPGQSQHGWRVERVPRKWNAAAHTAAGQALKLWRAGGENRPTLTTAGALAGSVESPAE